MNQAATNVVHWGLIGTGFVVSVTSVLALHGDAKIAGAAVVVLSIAQGVHKLCDELENKATLVQAVDATIPVAIAAAKGNPVQEQAVKHEILLNPEIPEKHLALEVPNHLPRP